MSPVNDNLSWLARFRDTHGLAACRDHDPTFGAVFVRGKGAFLWDVEGNEWIDLTCGFSATNFGHSYQPLVAAACEQLSHLTHVTGEPHIGRIELAERLIAICGSSVNGPSSVIFNATGARAVESAWKAAVAFRPGKLLVVSFGFHGRSIATAALSATHRSSLSTPMDERVITWPTGGIAYCARCPLDLEYPSCSTQCVDRLVTFLRANAPQVSAILVEPALGAQGYIFPPADYFRKLRKITQELGILLIADEIQTGLGRSGNPLLSGEQGWQPDLAILGKSLGGGIVPIAAVVGRTDVINCIPRGSESESFAATPLACAVALRGIDLLRENELFERGQFVGQQLRSIVQTQLQFMESAEHFTVEGEAACCAVEFASKAEDPQQCSELAKRFVRQCVEQRIRVHWTGPIGTRVVMLPPLTMTDGELADTQKRIRAAVRAL